MAHTLLNNTGLWFCVVSIPLCAIANFLLMIQMKLFNLGKKLQRSYCILLGFWYQNTDWRVSQIIWVCFGKKKINQMNNFFRNMEYRLRKRPKGNSHTKATKRRHNSRWASRDGQSDMRRKDYYMIICRLHEVEPQFKRTMVQDRQSGSFLRNPKISSYTHLIYASHSHKVGHLWTVYKYSLCNPKAGFCFLFCWFVLIFCSSIDVSILCNQNGPKTVF